MFERRDRTTKKKKKNNCTNERHAFSALSGCLNVRLTNDRGYDRVTTFNLCYLAKRRGVETRCDCFGFVFSHSFIYREELCKMKGEGKTNGPIYDQVGCEKNLTYLVFFLFLIHVCYISASVLFAKEKTLILRSSERKPCQIIDNEKHKRLNEKNKCERKKNRKSGNFLIFNLLALTRERYLKDLKTRFIVAPRSRSRAK